jgi:hypothetical protein
VLHRGKIIPTLRKNNTYERKIFPRCKEEKYFLRCTQRKIPTVHKRKIIPTMRREKHNTYTAQRGNNPHAYIQRKENPQRTILGKNGVWREFIIRNVFLIRVHCPGFIEAAAVVP